MANSGALLLRFGVDAGDTAAQLSSLAGNVTKSMTLIAGVAAGTSKALREELASGAASATKSLLSYAATWDNLRTAATLGGEAMKLGFALHHPVLAVGMKLLGDYKYALGALAAGALTAVEAFKFMADQVERANQIIAGAERANVSTTFFQMWTEQAVKARLSVEEMERALQHASTAVRPVYGAEGGPEISKFLRYSDELQNGRGFTTQSYAAFQSAGDNVEKLQVAAALVVTDFQRIAQETGDTSMKARAVQAAVELWGEGGRKLEDALARGKITVEEIVKGAQENARVYSDDLLRATRDVNDQLAEARDKLSKEMHPAMENFVRLSNAALFAWTGIVGKAADVVGWLSRIPTATIGTYAFPGIDTGLDERGNIRTQPLPRGRMGPLADRDDPLRRESGAYTDTGERMSGDIPLPVARKSLTEIAKITHAPREAAAGSSDAKSAIDTYIESLEKANAVAKAELETLGKSNIEKAKAVDLARAEEAAKRDGAALTDAQRDRVLALADAEGRLKDAREAAQKAQQDMNSAQQAFAGSAEGAVEGLIIQHKKLGDVLRDVIKELERMALKALLTGGGPLGGLFGASGKDGGVGGIFGSLFRGASGGSAGTTGTLSGLLSPGFMQFADGGIMTDRGPLALHRYATGGIANSPQLAMFGEGRGPEAYVPLPDGRSIPVSMRMPAMPSMAGARGTITPPPINQYFQITGAISGSDVEGMVRQGAAAAVSRYDEALLGRIRDKQDRSW